MSDDIHDDELDGNEWDSGPYCRHWGDPSDCGSECATCGHQCCQHGQGCIVDGCACEEFTDKEPA